MDLQKLRELKAELAKKAKALVDEHADDWTEERNKEFENLKAEIEKVQAQIDRKVDVLNLMRGSLDQGVELQNGVDSVTGGNPAGTQGNEVYAHIGLQMLDVATAATERGGQNWEAAMDRLTSVHNATNATSGSASDGGFLIQREFSTSLLKMAQDESQLYSRCMQMPIGANFNGTKFPTIDDYDRTTGNRFGGVRAYWADEATTVDFSKLKFSMQQIDLKKMMGFCKVSEELLADATALEGFINIAFPNEFGFVFDDAILRGNGVGKPEGILESPALISVAKESGQAADTVVYKNIVNMWSRLPAATRARSIWIVNQEVEPQLDLMMISDGTTSWPVYLPPRGAVDAPYGTMKGRPVITVEQCSALGDVGDIMLLDLSQYLIINKGGMRADRSVHVEFLTDQTVFRFTTRMNGRPLWKKARTPYKGTNTISPFVTLAARA